MSPDVVAEHVKALPVVSPLVGQDTLLLSAEPATLTVVEPLAVTVFVSRALALIVWLPLVEQVTEIVLVVEVPVHPVGRVQVNVYGAVPPEAVAVHVNATFTVALPQLTVTATGCPATVTDAEPLCVTALLSLAALLIE